MSAAPRVSVLLPVYNCDTYLRSALQSVLSQTFSRFELIAVDDGSTDDSLEILHEVARGDARVRIISRPNTGIVGALNDALEAAQCDLLARMDGDDLCMAQRLEKQVEYLDAHPECVALGTRVQMIDPEGALLRLWSMETTHDAIDADHLRGRGGAITHPAVMMRREAVDRVGGYRQKCNLAEDLDLFLRLAEVGRLANLPDVLLHYRMHLSSTGATKREKQRAAAAAALADAYDRRGLPMPDLDSIAERPQRTEHEVLRTWAWWALGAGNVASARKHAWASFVRHPFEKEQIRMLACAIRGH